MRVHSFYSVVLFFVLPLTKRYKCTEKSREDVLKSIWNVLHFPAFNSSILKSEDIKSIGKKLMEPNYHTVQDSTSHENKFAIPPSPSKKHLQFVQKYLKRGIYTKKIQEQFDNHEIWHRRRRTYLNKKLFVYGTDDRLRIQPWKMRRYPYSNIVRLSSGCTGTLLTPSYVLTAAHCVHDGNDFRNHMEMLRVQVPDKIGQRVYYIKKISVPATWLRADGMSESMRSAFDYAIVTLDIVVAGRDMFMPLHVPESKRLNEDIFFLGFPFDYSPSMYKSTCLANSNLVLMRGNLMLSQCDSAVGNSGAAIYTDSPRHGRKIIGVLSNTMAASNGFNSQTKRYSIVALFTWSKLADICSMVYPEGREYKICPDSDNIHNENMRQGTNRIIPFFG